MGHDVICPGCGRQEVEEPTTGCGRSGGCLAVNHEGDSFESAKLTTGEFNEP